MNRPDALARAYRESMQVQDACNFSGVAHSLVEHLPALRQDADQLGIDLAAHPVTLWFLDKLAQLAGRPDRGALSNAYFVIDQVNSGRVAPGTDAHRALFARED